MTLAARSLLLLTVCAAAIATRPVHAQPPMPLPKDLPKSPKVPTTYEGLFAEREARAVAVVGYLQCMQRTITALRTGVLGNVPRAWSITCVQQGNEWRGVFGELTDDFTGFAVRLQFALRGPGVLVKDPVDTAAVNGTARALLRGLAAPAPGRGTAEYIPVPLAQKGFTEVWFVPVPSNPTRMTVGGDSLIQMTADGKRELGHSLAIPPIRQLTVPTSGASYTLPSLEERLPLLSELVVARMALDVFPEVRIRTRQYDAVLTRANGTWTSTQR